MRTAFVAGASLLCGIASAEVAVYTQSPASTGALYQSSRWGEDGSDYDQWVWDSFILPADQDVTAITWRGGFKYGGSWSGPVVGFEISIWPSIAVGTEPAIVGNPLVEYWIDGDAGQTPAGTVGGISMYDHSFTLPTAFHATAGVKYWVQIEAWHNGLPEWSLAQGTGGNGSHFRGAKGSTLATNYATISGDTVFTLYGPAPIIPEDLNNDSVVDDADLGLLLAAWGTDGPAADLNADGVVDGADLGLLLSAWS